MKKTLLILFSILITSSVMAQIMANQIDDFEDGTSQNWKHSFVNPDSPVNIATGGPSGVNDNFLRNSNNGNNGTFGARHIMFNKTPDVKWTGNYTAQGIVAIRMNIRNSGVNNLHLRIAFRGGDNVSWMGSTTALVVATGGGWSTIEIPIQAADFTVVSGPDSAGNILTNVIEMRILSNDGSEPSLHKGDLRVQISDYDNIKASTTFLSTKDSKLSNAFSISPNPGRDRLNVKLSKSYSNANLEVFDVLGKKIYYNRVSDMTKSVNVSQWNSGVYLVRLTTDSGTQTKRFVKQ